MIKTLISWKAPEYIMPKKTADWFWAVGIIATAIIIASILFKNVLFAVFIFITTLTIFLYAKRDPEIIDMGITEEGVRAGRNVYPFSLLKAFYVDERGEIPQLLLKSSGITNQLVSIPLVGVNPEKIREILKKELNEEELAEPLAVQILQRLGF
jgi:hypothetical protein